MKRTLTYLLMLTAVCTADSELSFPIDWSSKGYLHKYIPRSVRNFIGGYIGSNVDMIRYGNRDANINFIAGAAIWTGMGQQDERVIFDPRDMHYSLIVGIRGEYKGYRLTFELFHDCFHEIDRSSEPTKIWNLLQFRMSPENFSPANRRKVMYHSSHHNRITFKPSVTWEAKFGFFPDIKKIIWDQYEHDLKTIYGGIVRTTFLRLRATSIVIELEPTFWIASNYDFYDLMYGRIILDFVGESGIFRIYVGYIFHENRLIRPIGERATLGAEWEF